MCTVACTLWQSVPQLLTKLVVKNSPVYSAKSTKEILFTRGTTTGLNWVGRFAEQVLEPGDEVVISIMEHHSNIIPWQEACKKTGAKLVYAYLKDGQLDMEDLANKITEKTKFVSLAQVSNVLGCINPVKEIAKLAHQVGAYMVWMVPNRRPTWPLMFRIWIVISLSFLDIRC